MSKYINADETALAVVKATTYGGALRAVREQPTIDLEADYVPRDYYEKVVSEMAKRNVEAADIVWCKECRYWERLNYEAPKEGWCNDPTLYCDGRWTNADDFCSYGERSE